MAEKGSPLASRDPPPIQNVCVVVVRFARPEFDLITVIKWGIGGCRNYQYG
jgi:hypothetical protein